MSKFLTLLFLVLVILIVGFFAYVTVTPVHIEQTPTTIEVPADKLG